MAGCYEGVARWPGRNLEGLSRLDADHPGGYPEKPSPTTRREGSQTRNKKIVGGQAAVALLELLGNQPNANAPSPSSAPGRPRGGRRP